tara:strand:- start:1805 stop:2101 length:297 start_codon:yes stop_codon:yes gene_type:complete
MLFHITHKHDESICPLHDKERGEATFGSLIASLEENVDKVLGVWTDPAGHRVFMVVEASEQAQITMGLWPIIPAGTAEIVPVTDLTKMLASRAEKLGA